MGVDLVTIQLQGVVATGRPRRLILSRSNSTSTAVVVHDAHHDLDEMVLLFEGEVAVIAVRCCVVFGTGAVALGVSRLAVPGEGSELVGEQDAFLDLGGGRDGGFQAVSFEHVADVFGGGVVGQRYMELVPGVRLLVCSAFYGLRDGFGSHGVVYLVVVEWAQIWGGFGPFVAVLAVFGVFLDSGQTATGVSWSRRSGNQASAGSTIGCTGGRVSGSKTAR